jgi:hypothetical protein
VTVAAWATGMSERVKEAAARAAAQKKGLQRGFMILDFKWRKKRSSV